ncbi:DUF3180 family protein [Canibacter sp. lx-45]|uniref:DUF3180 family protein n=1 Tax=Canibacter zhuwentaonis TaxID=2837491 RepID=UPI001BDDB929|nr:DUF3180 family protein [Canibacter zhuwentaonis]MBT1035540.1 DUF3180 family protein [Canibacter zhuwentaonis]
MIKKLALRVIATAAFIAGIFGYCVQLLAIAAGWKIVTPTLLQSALLLALLVTLLVLGARLRTQRKNAPHEINPFAAVRLLAAARAGALLGAACAGFAAGLVLWIIPRVAETVPQLWMPTLVLIVTGVGLVAGARWVERVCRIDPPTDGAGGGAGNIAPGDMPEIA